MLDGPGVYEAGRTAAEKPAKESRRLQHRDPSDNTLNKAVGTREHKGGSRRNS
jgi:hypothetical protein